MNTTPLENPILYLITDDQHASIDSFEKNLSEALEGGVNLVQFREKSLRGSKLQNWYLSAYSSCTQAQVPLLLNADLLEHLPQDLPITGVHFNRRISFLSSKEIREKRELTISGYSAHSIEEISEATNSGFSFTTLSPIFDTPSKHGILSPIGTKPLTHAKSIVPNGKIIALGGIDVSNAAQCVHAGADGIAVMRAILSAHNPKKAAQQLLNILKNHHEKCRFS